MLYKELLVEWRSKAALGGILLYVFSSVFVVSFFFREGISPILWVVLFWLLMLFIGINTIAKSFINESRSQTLYLYQLASATAIIVAKSIYNIILLVVIGGAAFFVFSFFVGPPRGDLIFLLWLVCLGNSGIAISLTFISAITAIAGASVGLMAVLSFPVLLPQLLLSIRLCLAALDGILLNKYFTGLMLMNAIVFLLSTILFPYLWKE
ncbi:MAG: ABC transporter permease [Bacteroidia bacterium]|nr:ABC transporter permease [Bacteroidia bacterium]MDW8157988.1 ABC transporter permease [Bacteroidia bacterium]